MRRALVIVVFVAAAGRVAAADPPAPPAVWGGVGLDLVPKGTITTDDHMGTTVTTDSATTVGFTGLVEYRIGNYITVGLWPRYLLDVRVAGAGSSGTELDLRARVTAGLDVAPRWRVVGYGAGGYSWVFPPSVAGASAPNETGPCVTLGGGVIYAAGARSALAADLGYQLGFQGASQLDAHFNDLHVGIAVLFAFGR